MTTMEDLTKTQIVLLTLLVSFITSIATGIITTSLLAEAPQGVTQTIDRVVERTIERVVPASSGNSSTVKEITIVKEGDAIVASIEGSTKAIVRVKSPVTVNRVNDEQEFYALGVVVGEGGLILTDRRDISQNDTYTVVFSDGTSHPARVVKVSDTGNLVLLRVETDEVYLSSLSIIKLSDSDPKLGQTVIAMQGTLENAVAVGRVLSQNIDQNTVLTDIAPTTETPGGALLNLTGELIALKTSNPDLTMPPSIYTGVSSLREFIASNP
ncbi:MAG: trypsin-like peptidase domain-containing protein [Minisyncoccota bacterium]